MTHDDIYGREVTEDIATLRGLTPGATVQVDVYQLCDVVGRGTARRAAA